VGSMWILTKVVPRTMTQTVGGGRASRSRGSETESWRGSVRDLCTFIVLPADLRLAGGDVDPTAFLKTYNRDLEEDELLFPADEDSQMAERDDEDEDEDDGYGEPKETISRREIEAQIRKAAKEKAVRRVSVYSA
jgi:hypothetical protein